ncbi:alpha-2-macroglobulin-like protein 1 isoform X2 [Hyla sarda]|uniref:alpha-2-macroglobulin-like protein 1 isoform X2 n=1 Tax=Hyla sarda TaxID=327740 RepID=UPI0024C238C1|nr:alpha-2-macroglobulin-like protein 1 isoform X2 [Hyla sarda]
MQLVLLSICLSIVSLEVASASEPYYAVTVPAQMFYPSKERACITILNLKGELQLKMELNREQNSVLVAEDTINKPTYFQCYSFELPTVVDEEEVWFFHVSAHGDTLNINQTKKLILLKGSHMTYIQTDKPIYKPDQRVNFRIITLDKNFHAKNDKYPLVELIDPNDNRIQQWLDVSPHQGIVDLSFPLPNEPPLGDYTINIPKVYKTTFSVSEYVLKKFYISTDIPKTVRALDKSLNMKACGRYTYGKPVSGTIKLLVCKQQRPSFRQYFAGLGQEEQNCQNVTMHTDDKGCLSREMDLAFFNMSSTKKYDYFTVSFTLTEDISGDTAQELSLTFIVSNPKMDFESVPKFYQKGIPLTVKGRFSLEEIDEEYVSNVFVWLHPLYSESNSYLTVGTNTPGLSCDPDQYLTVEYYINTAELNLVDKQLHFFYFFMSKGVILTNDQYYLDIRQQSWGSVLQGNFTLKIPIDVEYFPTLTFVVYTILDNGDIPSNTKEFKIPLCLKNKIKLKFAKEEVQPGEKVNLEVQAEPGSLCSLRSVDKGLLLHRDNQYLLDNTKYWFYGMSYVLSVNKRGWPYSIEDFEKYPCLRNEQDPQAGLQEAAWYHGDADVYMMLKQSNLKIFTNTKIRKPVVCASPSVIRRIAKQPHKKVETQKSHDSKHEEKKTKSVKRTIFPETWLYDLVSVGPQGHTELSLTTPHSITTWETDAFCLGKSGYGETSGVGLTTFQPYFIDLILPFSVVEGEEFTITAYVFSYLKSCMKVFVSLSDSKNGLTNGNIEQSQCVCEDQTVSFTWNVSSSKPGNLKVHVSSTFLQLQGGCKDQPQITGKDSKKDILEKTIIVKPSGILKDNTQTFLLCPSGDSLRRTVTLEVPEKVVPGSDQALITVFGNIMGSAIDNIGESLKLPSGSGEQNLMNFIPISYIVKYLESTKKLTPKIKEKASTYLTKGYLSMLMFKKDDGSYSVYHGNRGSIWLTAFTVRSFSHAQDLIYIQEKHIQDAVKWLTSLQLPNGCFEEVGKIFNNYLMREDKDNVTITAYITIALLEHGHFYHGSVVENALKCLKNAVNDVTTTYTQALLAYVFTLSGDSDLRKHMLETLDKAAIKEDGSKHWAANKWNKGDVEVSSYVLLALLSDQTTSQRDVEEVSPIVSWIIKRQRPSGGFLSTQDTAVALQALTKYAKATYTDILDVSVSVRSLSGFHKQFHVDNKNSLLIQREILSDIPGEYTLTATGTGCVYIQTHLKYHTTVTKSDAFFILKASAQPSVHTIEGRTELDLLVEASYSGERNITNTVIIEVQLLSGFVPNKESVEKLKENHIVKRTELTPDKVIIYLDKLTHETESLRFSIRQELFVNNLQAANVKIYDYYAPDENAVTDYNFPCSTST